VTTLLRQNLRQQGRAVVVGRPRNPSRISTALATSVPTGPGRANILPDCLRPAPQVFGLARDIPLTRSGIRVLPGSAISGDLGAW
jgi:hypothetical protein